MLLVKMYQRIRFLKLCALECIHHIYKHWRDDYALITLRPTEEVVNGVGGLIPRPGNSSENITFVELGEI